ncbi:MAG: glutamine--tRNA ligase/YqeY domain fusion protein [Endozoicomonadaceae bacterium]|nr:glutamine--tRNA ligase/YqeY domain fusion protein [Endozoicomonadaceae bacterium]
MSTTERNINFIEQIIEKDLAANTHQGRVHTRFPPEPNGYLHIGHAKSICLNFGLAEKYNGKCNLRFDDTNPEKEEQEYVEAIKRDVHWLGFEWHGEALYASSYFDTLYQWAVYLIDQELAYVDEQNAEQIRISRGSLTEPGEESPFRSRNKEENLALFEKMRAGEFAEGAAVLRAKIDMSHPNMCMRDPILYRIRKQSHHQTGDKWCIYPGYDFAHGQEDAIEGITHSFCTLEFAVNRPLYDWFIEHLPVPCKPRQYEFAPLNLSYTVTSKRKLKQLVDEGIVDGWDDPRLPTLSGLRRRGVPPHAIRQFCEMIGVTKSEGVVDVSMLEYSIRETLNKEAPRAMAVLNPLKVVITNMPEDQQEMLQAQVHPQDEGMGFRRLPFTREVFIDKADFVEVKPNKKWKRLFLGGEVRLRNGYVIRCNEVLKDEQGNIQQLNCTYDPETLGKDPSDRKVKGVIHWVDAASSCPAEVRLYDRLFSDETPDAHKERPFTHFINDQSLTIIYPARVEANLAKALPEKAYQFEREGYFCLDEKMTQQKGHLVFNRTIALRDSWQKLTTGEK